MKKHKETASKKPEKQFFVTKTANIFDEGNEVASEEFSFLDIHGNLAKIELPRDETLSVNALTKAIRRRNGALPKDKVDRNTLLENAINTEAKRYLRRTAHVGFVLDENNRPIAFVVGMRVIALTEAGNAILPPSWLDGKMLLPPAPTGNIEEWKSDVAWPALRSSRLGFALMAAFAAPLLIIARSPNFMINFFHDAKVGKSTLLLVAGSVAGPGEENDMSNWKATLSGGQQIVRAHNDTCYFINETGLIEDRKKAYLKIRDWIYWLAEGRVAIMNSNSIFTANATSAKFRNVGVSSSEHSIDVLAANGRAERDGGEYARCSDIPACAEGQDTIFDWPWEGDDITPEFARAELTRLRDACRRNHGVAIAPYVQYLAKHWDKLPGFINKRIAEFVERLRARELSNVDHHAAKNFGLVYAAGRLAVMAKVLPWSDEDPYYYAEACFLASVGAAHTSDALLEEGKSTLERALHGSDSRSLFSVWPDISGKIGGVKSHPDGDTYVCATQAFRRLFADEAQAKAVLGWLHAGQMLKVSTDASLEDVWQGKTARWPGFIKPRRSYEFVDPFASKDRPIVTA
jgi:hypothetical protein